ncbi:MAG: hypothetical protein COT73_10400 [Bdellovibrio sp. CG10_big_fil_rev_8_21_14_0_10_47_8]|nr:MAG: hypothetical protein COT73_10400 [Bdellovibrio sp. CG10_big_fil_rev_8_21_14_0_10_47_8]
MLLETPLDEAVGALVKFFIPILFLLFSFHSWGVSDSKNRVEELFIWKISDELKLSVPEEKSFSQLVRSLGQKRARVNEELKDVVRKLSQSQSTADREKLLVEQKKLFKKYNDLSLEEADRVQKILGIDRTAQYFVLKSDLTNRLKNIFTSGEKTSSAPTTLAPPKVIEQK